MTQSLRQLQENFQNYVIEKNEEVLDHIYTEDVNGIERIDIYKKGYSLRLVEILEKDFPIFRNYLGEEKFTALAFDYIKEYPSTHYNICIFSQFFSQFLLAKGMDLYLSEMVAFEWALSCALDAGDAEQVQIEQLAQVAPESWPYVEFDFHPSMKTYPFFTSAPKLVYALMQEEPTPDVIQYDQPTEWLIWRFNLQSYFESISPEKSWMIRSLQEGKNFSEICEGLCQWLAEEEVAMFAAGSLRNWIEKGLFSAIRVQEVVTS
jgi:hypothetical protein